MHPRLAASGHRWDQEE